MNSRSGSLLSLVFFIIHQPTYFISFVQSLLTFHDNGLKLKPVGESQVFGYFSFFHFYSSRILLVLETSFFAIWQLSRLLSPLVLQPLSGSHPGNSTSIQAHTWVLVQASAWVSLGFVFPSLIRNTRSSSYTMPLLNRPAHSKATLDDRSFSFASSSVWNSPNDVRCAPSLSSSKSHL